MNLSEILELSKAKIASATHAHRWLALNDAFVRQMVNECHHRIERMATWTFSEAEADDLTSTSGERELTGVPADYGKAQILYLPRIDLELTYFDDRQGVYPLEATGSPSHYSEWAGDIRLWPLPNRADTFLLRYYREWPELVNDEDEPVLPATFHDLLSDYAAWKTILRIPPEGNRFLPASAAEPFQQSFMSGLASLLDSPLTLKSLDQVAWQDFEDFVAGAHGIHW